MAHWKADLRRYEEDVRAGRRILNLTDKRDVLIFLNLEDDDVVHAVWEKFLDQRPSVAEIAMFFVLAIGLDPKLAGTRLRGYFLDCLRRLAPISGGPGLLDHLLALLNADDRALALISWAGLRIFCIMYPEEGERRITLQDLNHVINGCPYPEIVEQAVLLREDVAAEYLEQLSTEHVVGHA